jgi:hypothetical protein
LSLLELPSGKSQYRIKRGVASSVFQKMGEKKEVRDLSPDYTLFTLLEPSSFI